MKDTLVHKSEKSIYLLLTIIVLLFIVFQILELVVQFYNVTSNYSFGKTDVMESKVFSKVAFLFFNVLISIEILETFKEHKNDILYKTKIIMLIALTAIARKIITIDLKHLEYLTDIGIAALILSLTIGYYFISKIK